MKLAWSEASQKYVLAMSSGVPARPSGVRATMASRTFAGIAFTMSVAINPGATAFTRILYLAQLPCPSPCHSDDTGLGSHVIRLPEVSQNTHHGGRGQNYAAAALDHVGHNCAGHQEYALQVNPDHRIPHLLAHDRFGAAAIPLHELRVANNTGIVNENIDAAPPLDNCSCGGFDRAGAGDVHSLKIRFTPGPLDR